jgi:hypothetical protein
LDRGRRGVSALLQVEFQPNINVEVSESVFGDEGYLVFDCDPAADELRNLGLGLPEGAGAALLAATTTTTEAAPATKASLAEAPRRGTNVEATG